MNPSSKKHRTAQGPQPQQHPNATGPQNNTTATEGIVYGPEQHAHLTAAQNTTVKTFLVDAIGEKVKKTVRSSIKDTKTIDKPSEKVLKELEQSLLDAIDHEIGLAKDKIN